LGSDTDILSPDGITNHKVSNPTPHLTHANARINLVEAKHSNVEQDNGPPKIERQQVLLLFLNKYISLDKESKTFEMVKMAQNKGISIIRVHEQDVDNGGCLFSLIIEKQIPSCLILPSSYSEKLPFRFIREMNIAQLACV
jgi:hypothetical protein